MVPIKGMGRLWKVTAGLVALSILLGSLPAQSQQQQARRRKETGVVSLSSAELLSHIEGWTTDVAVFFYAPWCPYCKIVGPFWDMVGEYHSEMKTPGLTLARFDCERDLDAAQLCEYLGVDRYPLIQFFGYGSYYRNDPVSTFFFGPRTRVDRSARFEGPFDPEVMKDWTNMMAGVSAWHAKTEGFWSFLGWAPKRGVNPAAVQALHAENQALKEENRWLKKAGGSSSGAREQAGGRGGQLQEEEDLFGGLTEEELEAEWAATADSLLGEAMGSGDPFVELASGSLTDLEEKALIMCLKDFAGDYCLEHAMGQVGTEVEEPYCELVDQCSRSDFAEPECRPDSCPFNSEEGCERVRTCVRSAVLPLYQQQILEAQPAASPAAAGAKVPAAAGAAAGATDNGASSSERE